MGQYEYFAAVYDTFMEEVPREKWAAFIKEKLDKAGIDKGILLDLGCGTGAMCRIFADMGYDMIGVDGSYDMLNVAREEEMENPKDILYLCQDFNELELYGTVAAVISCCDCMNYITEPDDLKKVFKLVNNYLEKDGLFIFDINSEYKYREMLADNTFAEDAEDAAFIWQNEYDIKTKLNKYGLTLFIAEDMFRDEFEAAVGGADEVEAEEEDILDDGVDSQEKAFFRYYEEHVQRAYSLDEIKVMLTEAGMEFVAAYVDYTDVMLSDGPGEDRLCLNCFEKDGSSVNDLGVNSSDVKMQGLDKGLAERITIIAKEGFQEGKYYE